MQKAPRVPVFKWHECRAPCCGGWTHSDKPGYRVCLFVQHEACNTAQRRENEQTALPFCLSLTMYAWITPRNHELFNFHLEKLSARSSYYERICSIGYNSHLDGSLHLLEGIRAEAFNKRLNLSDK